MATIKKSSLKKAEDGEALPRKFTEGYEKAPEKMKSSADRAKAPEAKMATSKSPEKKQSFGEAFKAARSSGAKTFQFNGKSYTTQVKEEAAKKPAVAAPAKVEAKSAVKAVVAKVEPKVASPVKKVEPVKTPEKKIEVVKKSPADSVRAKMKVNSDTLRAKQTRYYTGKFGTMGGSKKK